jgi:hypothetical protein
VTVAERLAELRELAAHSGDSRMLDLALIAAMEELAEALADLSMAVARHASLHRKPPQQ